MNIKRLGIDLAKNSFSLCGTDEDGHIVLEKTVKRKELLPFLSQLIFPRISGHQVKNDNLNSRRCSNGKETK